MLNYGYYYLWLNRKKKLVKNCVLKKKDFLIFYLFYVKDKSYV